MKVISLFSGAGGFDLGFKQAGHEIIWANDIDKDCIETYKKNIGNHAVLGDISQIKTQMIPNGDIVIGGFPCQGFSMANKKRSVDDQRNKLYLEFKRVIKDKKPKYFFAENVRGILSLGGGKVIKKIVKDFSDAGYRVKYQAFNTADYGVPQTRVRVIISGTRKDIAKKKDYQFPLATHSKKGEIFGLKPWITIAQALEEIPSPDSEHSLKNHIYSKYKITNKNFVGHRKTDPQKPSPTILARGNGGGGVCAIQHPNNIRRMSVRESALVQTFPLDFEFIGSMGSAYRQVGNAVPVKFARSLAEQLSS